MTDKEEKLARDALKYGFIFMLVVSIPIWLPIVALGAFLCFPLYLIYLLVDEFNEDKAKMTSCKPIKARVICQYKEVNDSNAGIYWYKVIDETGKCRFESAYEDECLRFCEDSENNLQLEI